MSQDSVSKLCTSCGIDVSNAPRVKDRKGRYFCQPCLKKLQAKQRAAQAAEVPAEHDAMAALVATARAAPTPRCPQCATPMSTGAVLCVQCGYNASTGQAIATQVARVGPAQAEGEEGARARSFDFAGSWLLTSIGLSIAGGLVGALIWYAVAQALSVEISWIAILVGAMAGGGAMLGARGNEGFITGAIACAVAILAIGGAKYQLISNEYDQLANRTVDESYALDMLAAVIQEEAGTTTRGTRLGRRRFGAVEVNRMSDDEAHAAAREAWEDEFTEEERQEFLDELSTWQREILQDPAGEKMEILTSSLGILDYLFGFFAVVAAMAAGSGGEFSLFGNDD